MLLNRKNNNVHEATKNVSFQSTNTPKPNMKAGDYVLISLTDTGCGLDEETQERLFDPFYTTRKGHEGMGLGLSVCYGIIQNHQGKIGARSRKTDGLTIWFTLPITN